MPPPPGGGSNPPPKKDDGGSDSKPNPTPSQNPEIAKAVIPANAAETKPKTSTTNTSNTASTDFSQMKPSAEAEAAETARLSTYSSETLFRGQKEIRITHRTVVQGTRTN